MHHVVPLLSKRKDRLRPGSALNPKPRPGSRCCDSSNTLDVRRKDSCRLTVSCSVTSPGTRMTRSDPQCRESQLVKDEARAIGQLLALPWRGAIKRKRRDNGNGRVAYRSNQFPGKILLIDAPSLTVTPPARKFDRSSEPTVVGYATPLTGGGVIICASLSLSRPPQSRLVPPGTTQAARRRVIEAESIERA